MGEVDSTSYPHIEPNKIRIESHIEKQMIVIEIFNMKKQISKNAINNLKQYNENILVFRRVSIPKLEIIKEEEAWEQSAKASFKVAKVCLEINEIPNSIFNFQQTVEKLAKTILYSSTLYDYPEKGKHQPHILFVELFLDGYVEEKDEYGSELCMECQMLAEQNISFFDRIQAFQGTFNKIKEHYEEFLCENMSLANTFYYQYATMALCFLFKETEQNARYPSKDERGNVVTPLDLYPLGLKNPLTDITRIIERVFNCMDSPLRL